MKTRDIYGVIAVVVFMFTSCKDLLDRPPLAEYEDQTYWNTESDVRMYANGFYTDFFTGYGKGFDTDGAALLAYKTSDDIVRLGSQAFLTRAVPNSGAWGYTNVRTVNVMINRIETRMKDILTSEAYAHWMGIARFFRAYRYFQLATAYGDVPYYDHVPSDIDLDDLYKARTSRNEVMNAVYDDLKYAVQNVRPSDGEQQLNKYIVAGFISRMALHEGTWQKYYYKNNEQAKKFLNFAVEAAEIVINSGKYAIVTDYRSMFTSKDLKGNRDMLLYRAYNSAVGVTHSVVSNSNFEASTNDGPSTDLIKAYICADGKVYQNSEINGAQKFDLSNLVKTRDSRFEATFYGQPDAMNRGALVYITKFLPREAEARIKSGGGVPAEYAGDKNETDAPVLRYAEVLLNWIEAKAELASIGGAVVSQNDIDNSINKIRDRPLAAEATQREVQKTAPLILTALPDDPTRDFSVSQLLWEIRRERRMEFVFEYSRLADLKRWSKLNYMDTDENPDLLSGGWVNSTEIPQPVRVAGKLAVVDLSGKLIIYNGSNLSSMNGFYRNTTNEGRLPFLNQPNINPYLEPVSRTEIDRYASRGYELKQTEGWPQN